MAARVPDQSRVLGQLVRAVAGNRDDSPLAVRMCRACADVLGLDGGSLSVGDGSSRLTIAATDDFATGLDDVHEVVGEGPSLAAFTLEQIVRGVIGREPDRRWPLFDESVRRVLGPCAVYAVPIRPSRTVVGVSTFYQRGAGPDARLAVDDHAAQLLVNAVGVALVHDLGQESMLTPGRAVATRAGTSDRWAVRARINQATGMVMAQLRLRPADALALLRAHAFAHDTTLLGISEQLLRRDLDFTTTDPDPEGPDDQR